MGDEPVNISSWDSQAPSAIRFYLKLRTVFYFILLINFNYFSASSYILYASRKQ